MITTIKYVFFSLLEISQQFLIEAVLFTYLLYLFVVLNYSWASLIYLLLELTDCLIAYILTNYKLVFSNLLIGVIVIILLRKIYSHAS
jgi:hypothetical protein